TAARAKVLYDAGLMAGFYQPDPVTSRALHEEALAIRQELGDRRGTAESLRALGDVAIFEDSSAWRSFFHQSIALWQEVGDRRAAAAAPHLLAPLSEADAGRRAAPSRPAASHPVWAR